MAILSRLSVCLVALMLTAACRTGQEQWGPFRGQVVDFDSGEPIAGAYVIVMWLRERPALHLTQSVYDARETTTGRDGRFEIPYERRWLTAFVTGPAVSVFIPGYVMEGAAVVTGEGRPYIDPTFVGMRVLTTTNEKCQLVPLGVNADVDPYIPRYVAAQNAYKASLQCGRSD